MAVKKFRIRQRNAQNTYDILHPETTAEQVIMKDGGTVAEHTADYVRHTGYAAATGTGTTYAATLVPALSSYTEAVSVRIKVPTGNTGPATLNLNGLGAKAILKANGTPLKAGDLTAGGIYAMLYDGASFILPSEGGGLDDEEMTAFRDSMNGILNS